MSITEKELPGAAKAGTSYPDDAFTRIDETDDSVFYSRDRFVEHMDSLALSTVEEIISKLVVEDKPRILDLMAGWDSHVPDNLDISELAGLGLNENELRENKKLTGYVIHDLNTEPRLPFESDVFDVVLNIVSVDYMTGPFEVFREVGRVLKPGGLFLVIFSDRMFPQKAVKIWKQSGPEERIMMVEDFFRKAGCFDETKTFAVKGRPRPSDDKYSHLGIPSDPVYAVYADRAGGKKMSRPDLKSEYGKKISGEELEKRKKDVKHNHRCPYCTEELKLWEVPNTPFTMWDADYFYVCFNDSCPYFVRGWDAMSGQGNRGFSYRLMYDPYRDNCQPLPVPTVNALKENIVEDIESIKRVWTGLHTQWG